MDPETDIPGPILDTNAPLPRATDILISQPLLRSTSPSQGTATLCVPQYRQHQVGLGGNANSRLHDHGENVSCSQPHKRL